MANIKNIVKVMNFHSLVRVEKAKREARKFFGVEDELCRMLYQIVNNNNLKLDKKILLENPDGIVLNVYIGNDLGFCGDFNHQLQREINKDPNSFKIIIGRKIFKENDEKVLLQIKKKDFLNEYFKIDNIISQYIYDKKIKEINVFYNHYYNVNDIRFEKKKLFPLDVESYDDVDLNVDFVIEVDVNELISTILSLTICYQIKVYESNSYASENVMREKITNESLDKIEKIEEENRRVEIKEKKSENLKRQVNNYKNIMR
jgi:F0F1-type ATP synthase gamma subunit